MNDRDVKKLMKSFYMIDGERPTYESVKYFLERDSRG